MIPITISSFLLIMVALFLAVIFALWLGCEMTQKNRQSQNLNGHTQCRVCGLIYQAQSPDNPQACPACGTLNLPSKPQII